MAKQDDITEVTKDPDEWEVSYLEERCLSMGVYDDKGRRVFVLSGSYCTTIELGEPAARLLREWLNENIKDA